MPPKATFRAPIVFLCLLAILLLAGCLPPTANSPSEAAEQPPENEPSADFESNCLGREIEIPGSAPVLDLMYAETPIATQLAEADLIALGTIVEISHTCFNQAGGAFYEGALPYFEIRIAVEEMLEQQLDIETAELVLTQVGYSPLDNAAAPLFAVGDRGVAVIVARTMAWQNDEMRPILRPFDYFGSSLLLAQADGTFASGDGQSLLTLDEIRSQLTSASEPEEQVAGCAEGGIGVFTPEDVRCHLDSSEPEFVWELDEETAVLFTAPSPIADWVGGAIIYHIPTVSSLVLDINGEVDPQFTKINGRTAQFAFDNLMADTERMAEIKQRVQELWQTGSSDSGSLLPTLNYEGGSQGCGSIFVYKANSDEVLSEFLTIFIPATDFPLSEDPLALEIADYPEQIRVKIDLFGSRVYDFGEFPYCNDVGPEAEPQSVWVAQSGTLTVRINGTIPAESCLGDGFEATIRLENVVFGSGEETVQLDELLFEDVYVGWCAG